MILPAIDIYQGQSVRLFQGNYQKSTLVSTTPVDQARQINAANINCLHLVDLDGAKDGQPVNFKLTSAICQAFSGMVEIGGGIRSLDTIKQYLNVGVSRVILGSAALTDPELTKEALDQFDPAKIVIGVDGRKGQVATEGWLDQSKVAMDKLIAAMVNAGAKNFIVTDVARDGTMTGPNTSLYRRLQAQFAGANIIASGGVRNLKDVKSLQSVGIRDIIAGKSIYEGTLTLKEVAEVNNNAR